MQFYKLVNQPCQWLLLQSVEPISFFPANKSNRANNVLMDLLQSFCARVVITH